MQPLHRFLISLPLVALTAAGCAADPAEDESTASEQGLDTCVPPTTTPGVDPGAQAGLACPGPGLTPTEAAQAFVKNEQHSLFGSTDRYRTRQCVGTICGDWSTWSIYARSSFSGLRDITLDLSNGKTTAILLYGDGTQNAHCLAKTTCNVDGKGSVSCEAMQFPVVGASYSSTGRYLGYGCQGVTTDGDAALLLSGKFTSSCGFLSGRVRRPGTGGGVVETEIVFFSGTATLPKSP